MKYWAYIKNEILGPYEKEKLFEIPDFDPTILLCPQTPIGEKTEDWKEAASYPEISAMLNSPKIDNLKKADKDPAEKENKPIAEVSLQEKNEDIQKKPETDGTAAQEATVKNEKPDSEQETLSLNQLKPTPLDASPVNEESPSSITPLDNFEVNKLSSINKEDEEKKESPQTQEKPSTKEESSAMPDTVSTNSIFDPISISQINRKTLEGLKTQKDAAQEENPPANEKLETPVKESPETSDISAPPPAVSNAENTQSPLEAEQDIYGKLNELSRNSISKSDLSSYMEPINNKLSQIDKNISDLETAKLANEIKEMSGKLNHLEDVITEIKLNMSIERQPAENAIQQKKHLKNDNLRQGFSVMGEEIKKPKETVEDISKAISKEKNKIIDEGEKRDEKSKKPSLIKALFKSLLTVILLAAVLVISAIALKQAGIIDLAKILPFTFLTEEKTQTYNTAPASQTVEKNPLPQRDMNPEIIFFTKTYSNKTGTKNIENQIILIAGKLKGDTDSIEWQANKISGNIYMVNAAVPVPSKQSKIDYDFETDYIEKTVKPLNTQAKNVLDNLIDVIKPKKKPMKSKKRALKYGKSSRKKRTYAKSSKKIIKPAAKKPVVKEPVPEDDEYEYVYEDVENDETETEQYILPGMPGF